MLGPIDPERFASADLLSHILAHYAQVRSGGDDLSLEAERAGAENQIFELERELFRRESTAHFDTVRDLFTSDCATNRLAALMVLYRGKCRDETITDLLLDLLWQESDVEVLQQLLLWFRYSQKDARAIGPILRLADHPNFVVRSCAADALGAYTDYAEAVEALSRLSLDAHPNVREAASEELAAVEEKRLRSP